MGVLDTAGRKRKQRTEEDAAPAIFSAAVDMAMHSDEEGDNEDEDSNDEVDEFPELDSQSDSEEYDSEELDEDEEDEEEDGSSADDGSDDEPGIFPKAKTVVSEITGHPKRVYPEIEPDYDSDSSTEDVCPLFFQMLTFLTLFRRQIA